MMSQLIPGSSDSGSNIKLKQVLDTIKPVQIPREYQGMSNNGFIDLWATQGKEMRQQACVLSHNLRPLPEWGPARKEDRVDRYSSDTLGVHKIMRFTDSSSTNGLGMLIQQASSLSTINSCLPNSISGSLSSFSNAASTLTLPTTNDFSANSSRKHDMVKSESIL